MQHHVARGRQSSVGSCNPLVNLVPLRACEWGHGTCVLHSHSFQGPPESTTQKGTVYEERDRFEGGCGGSRGGTRRLSGSEAPPGGCRRHLQNDRALHKQS